MQWIKEWWKRLTVRSSSRRVQPIPRKATKDSGSSDILIPPCPTEVVACGVEDNVPTTSQTTCSSDSSGDSSSSSSCDGGC